MKKIVAFILALSVALAAATTDELERAYAKEFAFLKAQKETLTERLESVKKANSSKIAAAKKDIEKLQNRVLERQSKSEKLSEQLFHANENAQNISEDTQTLDGVLMQATATLKTYGLTAKNDKRDYQASLSDIFEKASHLIDTLATIRVEAGKFYKADGSEVAGKLVRVGNIATFGVSKSVSGALAPAGEGKFKIWKAPEAAATAEALAAGKSPSTLHIFMYENSEKEIAEKEEKTVYSVIDSGGIIGWVIVGLGIFGLFLAFLRVIFLSINSSASSSLPKESIAKLQESGVEATLEFLKTKSGATARLLKATVRNIDRDREHIEDIVAETILHESGRLDKFGSAIMVIAAVSPLLGLLGTVTGMIATFDIITEFGTGDPKLLSGGISIALVTTELGLVVAIPLILFGNLLNGWSEKVKDSMEHSALHLINQYNKLSRA